MDTATPSAKRAYEALARLQLRLHRYSHLEMMASWDRAAMMPPKGSEARAAAEAELNALMHRVRTDPQQSQWLDEAEREPLDEVERANLREIRRRWRLANAIPESLVEERTLLTSRCEHAWRAQRKANDWAGFLPNLREVVRITREEANRMSDALGMAPYDTLLDQYEPGLRMADVDRIFGDLKQWLPPLVAKVREKQAGELVLAPKGPFPIAKQREMNLAFMTILGFDFGAGRLDDSAHPFCGGVPEDIRLTTRYREEDFARTLFSTIHETGHARFEQNLRRDWLGQPIARARSFAIHESQSLSFEMQVARSRPFMELIAPVLAQCYGPQLAFDPDNLFLLFTRVKPQNLIRVEADELTYPLHVILRYEIEKAIVAGDVEPEDIPRLWDEKMQAYLGLDTRGNFMDGCMQDVHWSEGLFGYFPDYALGAMYAAQWFATIRKSHPDFEERVRAGDLGFIFDWLRDNIWLQGSRWETPELVKRASGEAALNTAHFRKHLETRYLG
jgi:carboxypeptidase Taq